MRSTTYNPFINHKLTPGKHHFIAYRFGTASVLEITVKKTAVSVISKENVHHLPINWASV